ncbi:MAG: MFS transporter [Pseudomonadota bacterium]
MTDQLNDETAARKRRNAALVLAPGLMAYSMGQTVLFAVAGPVIRDIGLTEFQFGMIISAAALMFVIASPIWGRLSDALGRKRVIVFGLFAYSITSLAFAGVMDLGLSGTLAVATVFFSLLAIRLTYAGLGAGIQPSSVALMADLSAKEDRASAVAIVGAAFGFGMILGPAAAAGLVHWGVLTPLYAIAGLGFFMALLAAFGLKEPERTSEKTVGERPKLDVMTLLPIMMIALLLFTAVSALQQTMAFYIQDYLGADAEEAAQATGICFVAMAVATLIVQGVILQRFKLGPQMLLGVGIPLMAAGVALYAFPAGFVQIVIASTLIGLGYGCANPGVIAAASLRVPADHQGAAAGLVQAMMAAGYIFGPLGGTALYQIGAIWTATLVGACLVCTLPFILAARTPTNAGGELSDMAA